MNKILIVALDNIGDAVMAAAVFPALRQLYPQAQLGFWVKQYAAGLFANNSLIHTVHASDPFWDKSPGRSTGSFTHFIRTWKEIRRARYDAAVVLNTEWRRSLACRLAQIPIRIGYRKRKSGLFLNFTMPPPLSTQHCIDDHRLLIERYAQKTLPPSAFLARLEVSADEIKNWRLWVRQQSWANHPIVVLHPFAGDSRRCWPLASWVQFIRLFSKAHPKVRFVALCGLGEEKNIGRMMDPLPSDLYRLWKGLPLSQMKTLLSQARLFIGGDSGPGHIAAALGIPVISLFNETSPERFAPRGPGVIKIIKKVPLAELGPDIVMREADAVFVPSSNLPFV